MYPRNCDTFVLESAEILRPESAFITIVPKTGTDGRPVIQSQKCWNILKISWCLAVSRLFCDQESNKAVWPSVRLVTTFMSEPAQKSMCVDFISQSQIWFLLELTKWHSYKMTLSAWLSCCRVGSISVPERWRLTLVYTSDAKHQSGCLVNLCIPENEAPETFWRLIHTGKA